MQTNVENLSPQDRRALLDKLLRDRTSKAADALYPLSEGERAIWYYHELNRGNSSLNLGEALRVKGGLDRQAMAAAFAKLIQRHDQLRGRLALLSGQPFKRVLPSDSIVVEELDINGLPSAEKAMWVGQFIDRRFDLERESPLRIGLHAEADGDTILVFAMHHMVADFWSLVVLIEDFFELYSAAASGRPAALPPVGASYASFVSEQMAFLASPESERHRAFWKSALQDVPEPPQLEWRAERDEATGSIAAFELEPALIERIRALSRQLEVSTYTTLLSAFALLLLRRNGSDAVVVGAPMTGRSNESLSSVVGYFDNPTPLLIRRTSGQTVRQFIRGVQDVVLEAVRHQAYPLQKIIEDLRQAGARSSPLFTTVFTMLQAPSTGASALTAFGIGDHAATATLSGVEIGSETVTRRSAQFDLALTLATPEGRLVGSFEYDSKKLSRATVVSLGSALDHALRGMVEDVERPVNAVSVLSLEEHAWLVNGLNDTTAPAPAATHLHQPFMEQARLTPHRMALVTSSGEMSYGEVDRRSNGIAAWLLRQGLVAGEHVAVLLPKGWQQVVAVLGVLKAGGAYLPLDPGLPTDRKERILARSQTRVVLAQQGTTDPILHRDDLVCLEVEDADPADDAPAIAVGGTARAYTIFTSGSTGEPKGVMISHAGALNTLHDVNSRLAIGPEDRVLALSSLSFDLSVYDIFGVLGVGGALVLPGEDDLQLPESWIALCQAHRVTLWNSVPALFKLALEAAEKAPAPDALESLRAVMLSGDWIPLDLPGRARTACGDHRFISMGGATEASVWSIWHEVEEVDPSWVSIPYGMPMTNQRFFVLDDALQPVLPGVVGDLYIGGIGVMLGYCGDDRLSEEALVRTSLDPAPLYRTGDLGRRMANGCIEFLGRRDSQVKIRGFRIETSEVETVLKRHATVEDCVVVAEGKGDDSHLVAYVVNRGNLNTTVLREHLGTLLPAYMVPSRWFAIDHLPLTANGKVDRQALAGTAPQVAAEEIAVRLPHSAEERLLVRTVRAILGKRVSLDGDLISVGANSIDAIRLAAALRQAGYGIKARDLFEAQSLAAVAARFPPAGGERAKDCDESSNVLISLPVPATTRQLERVRAALSSRWEIQISGPTAAGAVGVPVLHLEQTRGQPSVRLEVPAALADMDEFRTMVADLIGALAAELQTGSQVLHDGPIDGEEKTGRAMLRTGRVPKTLIGQFAVPLETQGWWRRQGGVPELLARAVLSTLPDQSVIGLFARDAPAMPVSDIASGAAVRRLIISEGPAADVSQGKAKLRVVMEPTVRPVAVDLFVVEARPTHQLAANARLKIIDWRDAPVEESRAKVCLVAELCEAGLIVSAHGQVEAAHEVGLAPLAKAICDIARLASSPPDAGLCAPLCEDPAPDLSGAVWDLGPLQHTMLIQSLISGDPGLYCHHLYWRAEGELEDARLVDAFEQMLTCIPCLRVSIDPWRAKVPVQVVQPPRPVEFRRYESDEARWREDLAQIVATDRAEGFDFTSAPLLRLYRIRLDDRSSILVLCHHHLLFDGWSVGLILRALLDAYDGRGPGAQAIGGYQRFLEHVRLRDVEKAASYWQTLLDGADLPTPLPAGAGASGGAASCRFHEVEAKWDPAFVSRLEHAARDLGVTPGSMLMTAWGLLLARHCGREDVVFGVTGAGRPEELKGMEEIVGLFINTVPVRVSCPGTESLASVVSAVHRQFARSREFEQTTFYELAEAVGAEPRSFDPFRTVVVFENYPEQETRRAPCSDLAFHTPDFTEQTATPLMAYVFPGRSWRVRFVYDAALFGQGALVALLGQLKNAIEAIAANPRANVRRTFFADDEDLALIGHVNMSGVAFDEPETLHELLSARAAAIPNAISVTDGTAELTYRELEERSSLLARSLVARGVRPGDIVGLACGHSIGMVIGLHAALKAGAAFLPLDENAPKERQDHILSASGAVLLLTDSEGQHGRNGTETIDLREAPGTVEGVQLPDVSPDAPAYVIYTSGSTGTPKGVVVSHRSTVNFVLAARQIYGWSPPDRILQAFSLGFDGALEVILGTVAAGATLVLRPPGMELSIETFDRTLRERQITSVSVTTAFWHLWMSELDANAASLDALRSVVIGGERNTAAAAASWRRHLAGRPVRLFNTYGPTEATIVACVSEIPSDTIDPTLGNEFPIGTPIPNVTAHVLDMYGHPCPQGAIGELYLGGAGLAIGYLGDPERTAAAFVQVDTVPGVRLYRTGDKARLMVDGQLDFCGRVDEQLKVRGYRVEPGEIEKMIVSFPGLRECAVALTDQGGSPRLVAYLIPERSAPYPGGSMPDLSNGAAVSGIDVERLRTDLRRLLPDYMVPERFFLLDRFPLSLNGKVDRKALRSDTLLASAPTSFEAPEGETEEAIAAIWSALLGSDQIGRNDNFFDIGGHSLLAMQMVARLSETFGVQPSVADMFTAPTVASLAEKVLEIMLDQYDCADVEMVASEIRASHV